MASVATHAHRHHGGSSQMVVDHLQRPTFSLAASNSNGVTEGERLG